METCANCRTFVMPSQTDAETPIRRVNPQVKKWSSPRTRGCSHKPTIAPDVHVVVPAHAGLFPTRTSVPARCGSRPRARGAVPRGCGRPVPRLVSSPRTRGCSAVRPDRSGCGGVSSPRTRGCSGTAAPVPRLHAVVPAHTGLFPGTVLPPGRRRGRPRARGAVPYGGYAGAADAKSSPRTRGCSRQRHHRLWRVAVVPAHAGLFRRNRVGAQHDIASSPRTRGCSQLGPARWQGRPVVPAHAGLFPTGIHTSSSQVRRPRARGAVPVFTGHSSGGLESSPRTRGCSVRPPHLGTAQPVVPAHAGLFPPAGCTGRSACRCPHARGAVPVSRRECSERRPSSRARGTVPATRTSASCSTWSSPRLRGCHVAGQDPQ